MLNLRRVLGIVGVLLLVGGSIYGADLSLDTELYSTGGLFTNPLFPAENSSVKITVRAVIEGKVNSDIKANVGIAAPGGEVINELIVLELDEGKNTATGSIDWKTLGNGQYFITATVDPNNDIAESDEKNNAGTIELPVVVDGRQPHFPWYGSVPHLRWATIWTNSNKKGVERWGERGVKALRWTYGTNLGGEWDANVVSEKLGAILDGYPGFGADECGGYATEATWDKFKKYTDGLKLIKKRMPDKFLYIWHCGSTYPEQMAMYRGACDLVVLESYVFYWGPKSLGHENYYTGLDTKMLPAWQADLLGPTGKGTQVITSVDLTSTHHKGSEKAFNRGKFEEVVRHLRRKWPEMRGIGFYHSTGNVANDQFVDRVVHDYFLMPVVTVRPGNLWVNKQDDGSYVITAAVSNIGAMDSGAVAVKFYVDGKLLKSTMLSKVPAGNNILENQVRVEAKWMPGSGGHDLTVELGPAAGSMILDYKQANNYYVP
ncbi:CARDB domain-containing protein [Planctomycetota bacterium]